MKYSAIRAARIRLGYTQTEVALKVGIAQQRYREYETQKVKPRVRRAIAIADALGVRDLRELWEDDDD
jgi:DNA-binding XRE family transcriptional regulator